MKKASFFIVLGLAVLLLFGCAGGGGPLGGVSKEPEGIWLISTYMDPDGDKKYQEFDNSFYVKISVNEDKSGYDAIALNEDGVRDETIEEATFELDNIEVMLTILNMAQPLGFGEFNYKLDGTFYDVSNDEDDLMFGEFLEDISNDEGIWFAIRYTFSTAAASLEVDNPLIGREDEIEKIIEAKTGYKVEVDFSEIIK